MVEGDEVPTLGWVDGLSLMAKLWLVSKENQELLWHAAMTFRNFEGGGRGAASKAI